MSRWLTVTFYRGDAKLQDGFYLHIKIANNNTKEQDVQFL